MTEYAFHKYADIFPLMSDREILDLADDIKENGLHEPIVLYENQILDGRNRYKACRIAGVEVRGEYYKGPAPLKYVVSLNLKRRHLDASQRAMVADKLADMESGVGKGQLGKVANLQTSRAEAAEMLNVSERSVSAAKKVRTSGDESLVSAVEAGDVAVSTAADIATLPREEQAEIVSRGELEFLKAAKEIRSERTAKRKEEQAALIAAAPPLPLGIYRVLYADPPWQYGNTGLQDYGHAEQHYPSMSLADLSELPISRMSDENSVLFLWATSPLLPDALSLICAWGFTYKTSFVWDKIKHNYGHYNSVRHEFLLVATKGSCKPDVSKLYDSVVSEERSEHSKKPESFRVIIDTLYPHGERVELFARSKVDGWEAWGAESE